MVTCPADFEVTDCEYFVVKYPGVFVKPTVLFRLGFGELFVETCPVVFDVVALLTVRELIVVKYPDVFVEPTVLFRAGVWELFIVTCPVVCEGTELVDKSTCELIVGRYPDVFVELTVLFRAVA